MKFLFSVCSLMLLIHHSIGQTLLLEPYQFISRAQDTVQAERGTFKVLEDRTANQGDSIELSFIRFKSTNPNPGPPIVYLSGGPGGAASSTAKGDRFSLFMKLRAVADVIAFDQRGTGLSQRLPNCPYQVEFEMGRAINKEEYVEQTTLLMSQCLSYWEEEGVNLKAYNTDESAKDLDALRRVLGAEQISLWGISYGSHLAFAYIRLFESKVNKAVLASLEGPDETIKLPSATQDFLWQIAQLAKDNYGSNTSYPELKTKILAVHERLKDAPATTSYRNRRGGRDTLTFSNFELQMAIASFYLKNPKDSKQIPRLYSQMYEGDFSAIGPDVMVVKRYLFSRLRPMALAMDLQSGISPQRKATVDNQINSAVLGSCINFLLYAWMNQVDFPTLPEEFRQLKPNKVDALLLSGTLDGRTYLRAAYEIAAKFENGQHLIIENAGHDLYMQSPLIGEAVLKFFQNEALQVERIVLKPTIFD